MKNSIIFIIVLMLIGGYFVYSQTRADKNVIDVENVNNGASYGNFIDSNAGLMFDYKISPDGYVVEELNDSLAVEDTSVFRAYTVINAREKAELAAREVAGEGPPTINIVVYKNELNQTPSQWVEAEPRYSNVPLLIGEIDQGATVAGVDAVKYRTDGLYLTDNVVVGQGDYIYHFSGAFLEEESVIHQDFKKLIDTVQLIPVSEIEIPNSSQKINPQVACESALAYMTFESGEAADVFVNECINGEHPEVIERYISDMGYDGSTI